MDENISEIFSSVPEIEETEISAESHVETKDDNYTGTQMMVESLDNSELSVESDVSMEFKDYTVENVSSDNHAGAVDENHPTVNESEQTSIIDSYEYVNEIGDVCHANENVVHEVKDNPDYTHENKHIDDTSGEIEPEPDLLEDLLKFSTRNVSHTVPYTDTGAVEVTVVNVPISSSEYPTMQSFNQEEYCMADDGVLQGSVSCDLERDVIEHASKQLEGEDNLHAEVRAVDSLHTEVRSVDKLHTEVQVQGVDNLHAEVEDTYRNLHTEIHDADSLHTEVQDVNEEEQDQVSKQHELESGVDGLKLAQQDDLSGHEQLIINEQYDKNKNNVGIAIEHEIEKMHGEVKVQSIDESSAVGVTDDNVLFEIKQVNVDMYGGDGEAEAEASTVVTEPEEEILPPMPRNLNQNDHSLEKLFDEEKIKKEGSLSIAEAISRDFDETDSEDTDKIQDEDEDMTSLTEKAASCESETMTVRDSSGQVYIVETVDDMLMFDEESFMQQHEDQPETVEVTVIEERYRDGELPIIGGATKKEKKVPPIPSHVLGRNIINPADDTFRNGKLPPKPRLGVKIPYRNLTSQIVSKDDIAKEIADRQRQRLEKSGGHTSSGDVLFAKKLTQRLARKISPLKAIVKMDESSSSTTDQQMSQSIESSDILAILEGDEETDKPESANHKTSSAPEETIDHITEMTKRMEREIALKQLNELPRGRGRRRKFGDNVTSMRKHLIEERIHVIVENTPSTCKTDSPSENLNEKLDEVIIKPETSEMPKITDTIESANITKTTNLVSKLPTKTTTTSIPMKSDTKPLLSHIKTELKKNMTGAEPVSSVETKEEVKSPNEKPLKIVSQKDRKDAVTLKEPTATTSKLKDEFPAERKVLSGSVRTYTRKRRLSSEQSVYEETEKVKESTVADRYVTKSSRIIKPKVIWDPDEPTTTRVVMKSQRVMVNANSIRSLRNERRNLKMSAMKGGVQKLKNPEIKNKKRPSEVDRLLMDEGAINMLYVLKNTEPVKKKTSSVISLDKVRKELANKTNEIKRDLRNSSDKDNVKSLRKKDTPTITTSKRTVPAVISRKKSKDSNYSSTHSSPASPAGLIYLNHAEGSRIIRRHSSSSFSSTDNDMENKEQREPIVTIMEKKERPLKRRSAPAKLEVERLKRPRRGVNKDVSVNSETGSNNKDVTVDAGNKYTKYKAFKVKVVDRIVEVALQPNVRKQVFLTLQVLKEFTELMSEVEADNNCVALVVHSNSTNFCQGINYKSLINDKIDVRMEQITLTATAISNFLKTLSAFPKILVAAVQGECIGLGVTMLPLFDVVIASDNAKFHIPNAKLGCIAEGGSVFSLPHVIGNVLVNELLYMSRKLAASEVVRLGLVTQVIWPEKFQQEFMEIAKNVSGHSAQFLEATKKQTRPKMLENIDVVLDREAEILMEHWMTDECQKNFNLWT